jgi:hypothetical protein
VSWLLPRVILAKSLLACMVCLIFVPHVNCTLPSHFFDPLIVVPMVEFTTYPSKSNPSTLSFLKAVFVSDSAC